MAAPTPPAIDQIDQIDQIDETELLVRARAGDGSAIGALYEAHREPALRMAQLLAGPERADDLLADAFARVVARFREGGGPTTNFHGYLFTAIRNRHRDLQRRAGRENPASDLPWLLEGRVDPAQDEEADHRLDDAIASAALARLPAPWQQVLLLLDVEGKPVGEVAELLGLTPAATASLAYRAREGLRTSYLDQLVRPGPHQSDECEWLRPYLSRYVRGSLPAAAVARADQHLPGCEECEPVLRELERVNARFHFLRFSPKRPPRQPGRGRASLAPTP